MTTQSAPSGTTPPVRMRAAAPDGRTPSKGRPAADSPATRSVLPPSEARSAYPSTALEGNAGSDDSAFRSSASTRPTQSASATRSTPSAGMRSRTSAAASSASMSGYVEARKLLVTQGARGVLTPGPQRRQQAADRTQQHDDADRNAPDDGDGRLRAPKGHEKPRAVTRQAAGGGR